MSETAAVIVAVLSTIAAVMAGAGKHLIQGRRSKREGVEEEDTQPYSGPESVTTLLEIVSALRSEVASLREDQMEDRSEIRRTWGQLQEMRGEISAERSLRQSAVDYIHKLHHWIAQHIPDGVDKPAVPHDLKPHITRRNP